MNRLRKWPAAALNQIIPGQCCSTTTIISYSSADAIVTSKNLKTPGSSGISATPLANWTGHPETAELTFA
jgi:hypothetical protein